MDAVRLAQLLRQMPEDVGNIFGLNDAPKKGLLAGDYSAYNNLTSDNPNLKADYKPLNYDNLNKAGAFRVTNQGYGEGKFNPDPQAGFSLVSKYNDLVGGDNGTVKWPNNESAAPVVKNMMTSAPENMGAHKYLQIIQSAKDLGLNDNDIYLSDR